jgi:hypothetical protein
LLVRMLNHASDGHIWEIFWMDPSAISDSAAR